MGVKNNLFRSIFLKFRLETYLPNDYFLNASTSEVSAFSLLQAINVRPVQCTSETSVFSPQQAKFFRFLQT